MNLLGVDTLEFGIEIDNYKNSFRPFLDQFQQFKLLAQQSGYEPTIPLGDVMFTVHSSGMQFYAYRLSCADFLLGFTERELSTNSPIHVRFLSSYLWSYGLKPAIDRFFEWFRLFNATVTDTRLSRVDLCTDTDRIEFSSSDSEGFVTRAKGKTQHFVDDVHSDGKVFSGFTIGRGQPMLARIYLKSLEVHRSGKLWMYPIWEDQGWKSEDAVWRVEFQLRREALKELGVSSLKDLSTNLDGIWAYCTKNWLALRQPKMGQNVSRWPLQNKWIQIQQAKFHQVSQPLAREKVRQGNLTQLLNQAAGLALSIAALSEASSLDVAYEQLKLWTEAQLMRKGTTFQIDQDKRKKQFIL